MIPPITALTPEYDHLLASMVITRIAEIEETVRSRTRPPSLLASVDAGRYTPGCQQTGVPISWAAASFEREASSNFNLNPAQGWPLNSRSRWIPHNGPFPNWTAAQIAAYAIDGLTKVGKENWSWAAACYYAEAFNGFGYRARGVHSPYLWAGSNIYIRGKFIADGEYSASAIDEQLGVIPMMARMIALRPELELPIPFKTVVGAAALPVSASVAIAPPMEPPEGHHDAEELQKALNKLMHAGLVVDDSYGRQTTAAVKAFQRANHLPVDGLAGPATWSAIDRKLAA